MPNEKLFQNNKDFKSQSRQSKLGVLKERNISKLVTAGTAREIRQSDMIVIRQSTPRYTPRMRLAENENRESQSR